MSVSFLLSDKEPKRINFGKERFLLVHNFRGISPWSFGSISWECRRAEHHGGVCAVDWNPAPQAAADYLYTVWRRVAVIGLVKS